MAARKTTATSDPTTRLADAALKRLARTPWQDLTLAAVARSARVPLADLQTICGAKPALLGLILSRIGGLVAARYRPERDSEVHDRLFDVAMCVFDVLAPHRKAMRSLYDGLRRDPLALIAARQPVIDTGNWLLVLAGADTGPALPLRALALAGVLARAVPVWLDDGPDLARTMARLDTDLRRGETVLDRMAGRRGDDNGDAD